VKLIEGTISVDNVYYDLDHEIARHDRGWLKEPSCWKKAQMWVDEMAEAIQQKWKRLNPDRPLIMGLDAGPMTQAQRDWIYTRPYFDLLIFGKTHNVKQAKQWRIQYKKPYVPQESWEKYDRYSYIYPKHRTHIRKFMWKFLMAKCQQMDLYMKPLKTPAKTKYPHNYDPRGWNKFEDDALVLRTFWNSLTDYPNLWFNGTVASGPGSHQYVLSSENETVAYCSSATGKEGVRFQSQQLKLENLALANGNHLLDIVKPDRGVLSTDEVALSKGVLTVRLPAFTDDIAVHVYTARK
jgi:hypothetical protein